MGQRLGRASRWKDALCGGGWLNPRFATALCGCAFHGEEG